MECYMTLNELLSIIRRMPNRQTIALTANQRRVLRIATGPLWVIAGPGSGKTEVLILRCLRLMYVDEVNPRAIFMTTFTEKAARELQDRLVSYGAWVASQAEEAQDVDISHVRVGTLHSLCNDIMHEFRYEGYQNYRLMDELEQLIFINEHSNLVRRNLTQEDLRLWTTFGSMLGGWRTVSVATRARKRLFRAIAFRSLVGRLVEYMVDIHAMEAAGEPWRTLAEGYRDYSAQLENTYRSDFSHVQSKFLEFLGSPRGETFLNGDGTPDNPGISHILVDEYQDTNPIQEAIYLSMARELPHNLMVVGDDDQAIYRFRGGTVDCLIGFTEACRRAWGDVQIIPIHMLENHRSHELIVTWCNRFIASCPEMRRPSARTPRPGELIPASDITARYGDYPAVGLITGSNNKTLASNFAATVRGMLDNGIITDPSDCALLLHSTKETRNWAGHYITALQDVNIDVYNPRGRTFLDQPEVRTALGALVAVLDPRLDATPTRGAGIRGMANDWLDAYRANCSPGLERYVQRARAEIASKPAGEFFRIGVAELFYILLSFEPFTSWQEDIATSSRLAKLTRLLEAYTSMPWPDEPTRTRGWLAGSATEAGQVSFKWRSSFYWGLVSILEWEKVNDEEDEYELFPRGRLPIMTIFQAKGLQFPFVFVAGVGNENGAPSGSHQAESLLYPFRPGARPLSGSDRERAIQDVVRLYYVAYSRAQYGLFVLAKYNDVDGGVLPLGVGGRQWLEGLGIRSLNEELQRGS